MRGNLATGEVSQLMLQTHCVVDHRGLRHVVGGLIAGWIGNPCFEPTLTINDGSVCRIIPGAKAMTPLTTPITFTATVRFQASGFSQGRASMRVTALFINNAGSPNRDRTSSARLFIDSSDPTSAE